MVVATLLCMMCRATRGLLLLAAVGLVLPALAGSAEAGQVKYLGGHPIAGGGFCHIEAPHVHVYKPHKSKKKTKLLYRVHDGHYHFVGDPAGHGYDGPKHAYYGHHPIAVDVVAGGYHEGAPHELEFCYLDGPHHHWYKPAPDLEFEIKGDAYWYVAAYPPRYKKHRKVMVGINAIYRPLEYQRPVIEVEPPVAYVGPVLEVHAHVGVHGRVVAPVVSGHIRAGIEVHVPTPHIEIALPGVVIVDKHHRHKHHKVKIKKRKHGKKRGKHRR